MMIEIPEYAIDQNINSLTDGIARILLAETESPVTAHPP